MGRHNRASRPLRRMAPLIVAGLVCAVLAPVPAVADTVPPAGVAETFAADNLPTWQTNGTVWDLEVVGDTVYVGGNFTKIRPPGASPGDPRELTRVNLAAFDVATGEPRSWAPNVTGTPFSSSSNITDCDNLGNGQWVCDAVWVVRPSPDGRTLYVGGDFTAINGTPRYRFAAFDTTTGAMTGFAPAMSSRVRAITATGDTVYTGGHFTAVGSTPRQRLAAFDTAGNLRPWAPTADAGVYAMVMAPDNSRVVLGGLFDLVNGVDIHGLAAVDAATGASTRWDSRPIPKGTVDASGNRRNYSWVTDLVADRDTVYASADGQGGGIFDGRLAADPYSGALRWVDNCLGATQALAIVGDILYSGSHAHDCSAIGAFPEVSPRWYFRLLAETARPAGSTPSLLHWFPNTNGGATTYNQGPRTLDADAAARYLWVGGDFTMVNQQAQQGLTRFARDDVSPDVNPPAGSPPPSAISRRAGEVRVSWTATYDNDNEELTYEVIRNDDTANPVFVTTQRSNPWTRPAMQFTDTGLAPGGVYRYRIRVSDPFGNRISSGNSSNVTVVAQGTPSPYADAVLADRPGLYWRLGEPSGTTAFDEIGLGDGRVGTGGTFGAAGPLGNEPSNTAINLNGSSAGTVIGTRSEIGPQQFTVEGWFRTTTTAGGKLIGFGNSATGLSSGYDRHVYMTNAGNVVFGVHPGRVETVQSPRAYNDGAWHHVAASLGSGGMRLLVDGQLVGSRATVTSAQGYAGYWRIGGDNLNGWTDRPTSAYFAGQVDEFAVYPSQLPDAEIAGHAAAGSAAVPNEPPTARLTASCSGQTCQFDGSGSSDRDGTVAGHAWNFGDGLTGTGVTPQHRYAAAGSYAVQLTVTDDDGATATATTTIGVGADGTRAADTFERAVSGGWGSANVGGGWALTGSSTYFSVAAGAGRMQLATPGLGLHAALPAAAGTAADVTVTVSADRAQNASGLYLYAIGREVGPNTSYRGRLRLLQDGSVRLAVTRLAGSSSETLISGESLAAGLSAQGPLRVRFQVSGTAPTTLRLKVWQAGTPEPAPWQLETTDATTALQASGAPGLRAYVSGSSTQTPVTVSWDDFGVASTP